MWHDNNGHIFNWDTPGSYCAFNAVIFREALGQPEFSCWHNIIYIYLTGSGPAYHDSSVASQYVVDNHSCWSLTNCIEYMWVPKAHGISINHQSLKTQHIFTKFAQAQFTASWVQLFPPAWVFVGIQASLRPPPPLSLGWEWERTREVFSLLVPGPVSRSVVCFGDSLSATTFRSVASLPVLSSVRGAISIRLL